MELNKLIAVLTFPDDRSCQFSLTKRELSAGMCFSSRLCEALPDTVAFVLEQQHLHRAAGRYAMTQKPRGKHTGVV